MADKRSAKGEMVDFDLYRAKQEIAASPPPNRVQERQAVIDKRLRRKLNKVGGTTTIVQNPSTPKTNAQARDAAKRGMIDTHVVDLPTPPTVVEIAPTPPIPVVEKVEVEDSPEKTTKEDLIAADSQTSEITADIETETPKRRTRRTKQKTKPKTTTTTQDDNDEAETPKE